MIINSLQIATLPTPALGLLPAVHDATTTDATLPLGTAGESVGNVALPPLGEVLPDLF